METFCGGGAESVAIPVGLLAAGENEGCVLLLRYLRDDFAERDGVEADVGFDVDGAVDAHGERGAEGVLYAGRANGNGDNLSFDTTLAEAESFLHAVLVHGVHDE